MKILVIACRLPEKDKKGDQVLSFHRLNFLAKMHDIKLICFGDLSVDKHALSEIKHLGIEVELIKFNKLKSFINLIKSIFDSKIPFQCALYKSIEYKSAIISSLHNFRPDLIHAITIRPTINLGFINIRLAVDMIDSMALNFSRRMLNSGGLKRLLYSEEYRRVSRYEYEIAEKSTYSFLVSSLDKERLPLENVFVLPLGVDTSTYSKNPIKDRPANILFSGNMNYQPNIEAVIWFYENCWKRIKAAAPQIQFIVCGANPTRNILRLAGQDAIHVTGRVPSMAKIINSATVSISPMQSGSGMQFKVLEAMACCVPVVTTTIGLGSIGAKAGVDLLVADNADDFIENVLSLLDNPVRRDELAYSARNFIEMNHAWTHINKQFEEIISIN